MSDTPQDPPTTDDDSRAPVGSTPPDPADEQPPDPALDDSGGRDWADEGGATPEGAATATAGDDHGAGA